MMKNMIKLSAVVAVLGLASVSYAEDMIAAGKKLVDDKGCAACHGADLKTAIDPSYPKLAGQHKDYLENALKAYKGGKTAPNGRTNAIMAGQAQALSHDEIRKIAAYIASLKGDLSVRK